MLNDPSYTKNPATKRQLMAVNRVWSRTGKNKGTKSKKTTTDRQKLTTMSHWPVFFPCWVFPYLSTFCFLLTWSFLVYVCWWAWRQCCSRETHPSIKPLYRPVVSCHSVFTDYSISFLSDRKKPKRIYLIRKQLQEELENDYKLGGHSLLYLLLFHTVFKPVSGWLLSGLLKLPTWPLGSALIRRSLPGLIQSTGF